VDPFDTLDQSLRRSGFVAIAKAIAAWSGAVLMTWLAFEDSHPSVILLGVGAVFALVGGWQARYSRRLVPVARSAVRRALLDGSTEIVWAYAAVGSRTSAVDLFFRDGASVRLLAPRADREVLLGLVQERCPHALLGYGEVQERAYRAIRKSKRGAAADPGARSRARGGTGPSAR
jgi:hypothetical protein